MIMSSHKSAVYATNRACLLALTIILASFQLAFTSPLQSSSRTVSGTVVDDKGQVLPGMVVIASAVNGELRTTTNGTGQFTLETPNQDVLLRIEGPYIKPLVQLLTIASASENLRIQVEYRIPPIHQSLVITASALEPLQPAEVWAFSVCRNACRSSMAKLQSHQTWVKAQRFERNYPPESLREKNSGTDCRRSRHRP